MTFWYYLLRNLSAQLRLVQQPVKTSTVHIMGNPFDDLSRIIRVRYIVYNKLCFDEIFSSSGLIQFELSEDQRSEIL